MSSTNYVTRAEFGHAAEVVQAFVSAGPAGMVGIIPADLDGHRVLTLVADPEDGKGSIPLAIVVTSDLFDRLVPHEGNPELVENEEGVA